MHVYFLGANLYISVPTTTAIAPALAHFTLSNHGLWSSLTYGMASCTALACCSIASSSAFAARRCPRATATEADVAVAACEILAVCEAHPARVRMMNSARWIKKASVG